MNSRNALIGFVLVIAPWAQAFALCQTDHRAIHDIIARYTRSWNESGGRGFGDDYTEGADFVNIFAMRFKGDSEIEKRHVEILSSFFKGSRLKILNVRLREIRPEVVIAHIDWELQGFRTPKDAPDSPGETRTGVYSQVFSKTANKWAIEASHNTLSPKNTL